MFEVFEEPYFFERNVFLKKPMAYDKFKQIKYFIMKHLVWTQASLVIIRHGYI